MIYIIVIEYLSQLPILCGPPQAAAAVFCCILFLDILSVEWRTVSCRIWSPEMYTHLLLGISTPSSLDWGHYAIFFDKNRHILFSFQRTWNHLRLPICWFSLVRDAIQKLKCCELFDLSSEVVLFSLSILWRAIQCYKLQLVSPSISCPIAFSALLQHPSSGLSLCFLLFNGPLERQNQLDDQLFFFVFLACLARASE